MRSPTDRLTLWVAYGVVGVGALVMLLPFYFMFVFASHSRTEIFSLPPPLFFGDEFLANLKILTERMPFWRNLGWSLYVAIASTLLTLLFCSMGGYAFAQFESTDNMTERQSALATLANGNAPQRVAALDIFYNRYRDNPLVLDKWFSTQAFSTRADTVTAVADLLTHNDFTLNNPNRVRSLIGAFGGNQRAFHRADGSGYRLYADTIIALDPINPQTAAKLVPPLGRWKRFDAARASLMRAELERIVAAPGLSKDVYEQASKSLG